MQSLKFVDSHKGNTSASTFTNDLHKDRKVDYVMANPPFNLKDWRGNDEGTDYFDVPELCRAATFDEIRDKDFSFVPSKYIEFVDHDLEIDYPAEMTRIQNDMREILFLEKISQTMLTDAFRGIGYEVE